MDLQDHTKCSNFNIIAKRRWVFMTKLQSLKIGVLKSFWSEVSKKYTKIVLSYLTYVLDEMCWLFVRSVFFSILTFFLIILAINFAINYYQLISVMLRPQVFFTKSWKQQERFIPLLNFYELILYTLYIYILYVKKLK